jgi:glucan 1,3-beta-glucosidase
MSNGGSTGQMIESMVIIDSNFTNTPLGILTSRPPSPSTAAGSLALENVAFSNVPAAVKGPASVLLAGNSGTITTTGWVHGNVYSPTGPTKYSSAVNSFTRPAGLLSGKNYYSRSKPQYQNVVSANFMSARTAGAKGDGVTDDSTALQNVINSATSAGKIVFLDAGIYKVTVPITIRPGAKIVGEAYPVIMASGSYWSNANTPIPVLHVGLASGETGVVELSDFVVSTQGATAGAVLIQWNLASPAGTPSGMCMSIFPHTCCSSLESRTKLGSMLRLSRYRLLLGSYF